ncbi:MAG TPA: hypothetical protein DDZ81_06200 [Acetobacteraceae bacterium]|jgi:uncharacterized protein|nr:hypothetical protein [Acetobacteraceae bacterium]
MRIKFDPIKDAKNIAERGLPFSLVEDLDWETAIAREDRRKDYGERRVLVLAYLGSRLHAAVVTYQDGAVHVISLRKAHWKEVDWYEQQKGRQDSPAG